LKRKPQSKRGRYGDGCVYQQRGRRIWWLAWYEAIRQPDGTTRCERRFESTGTDDKKEARRRLRAKLQLVGGRRLTATDPRKVSYEDLRQNFVDYCVANSLRSLKEDEQGHPTLNTLPRLDSFFGGWRAREIQVSHLKRFRIEGKRDGLSDARLNRYMATLRKMFRQGIKDELITNDEEPSYFPTTEESKKAIGAIFIQPEWYTPLRKTLKEPLRSAFTVCYHAAIRVGELERIRWRDVNVAKRFINLPEDITKTGDARSVPLPSEFDRTPGQPDELVFPLGDCRERWRTACVKVGAGYYECRECGARCDGRKCPTHGKRPTKRLRYKGITLRHTRHTALRNMSDAGMREKRIMDISGHVTRSTFDRYNIGKETDVAEAGNLIEKFHQAKQRLTNVNQSTEKGGVTSRGTA
jgi:integrase